MVGHLLPSFIRSKGPAWPWSRRGPGLLTGQKALPPPPVRPSALVGCPDVASRPPRPIPTRRQGSGRPHGGAPLGRGQGEEQTPCLTEGVSWEGAWVLPVEGVRSQPRLWGLDGKHGPLQFGKPVLPKCSPASRCSVPPLVLRTGTPGQDRPSEALAAGPPLGSLKAGPHPERSRMAHRCVPANSWGVRLLFGRVSRECTVSLGSLWGLGVGAQDDGPVVSEAP